MDNNKGTTTVQDNIFDVNKYTLRKNNFKHYYFKAQELIRIYNEFTMPYVQKEEEELKRFSITNPELFNGLVLDNLTNNSEEYVKKLKEILSHPNLIVIASKLEDNNKHSMEAFVSNTKNAELICEILFIDCDINHNDDYLNSLTLKEFSNYLKFMVHCFRFFLIFFKTFEKNA